ncbi:hypothetical protein M8J75_001585 [Diaphorina citri]|nr:hypothetical protein M8J75_000633 [Diaphorina citri]KAI5700646.1 hypothetical protein M8J75_001585 [Diaphorina citri]
MDSSISQHSISGPASSAPPAPCTQLTSSMPPVPSHTTPLKRTATQIRNRRRRAAKIRDASARRQDPSRLHVTPEGRFIVTLQQAMALFRH